MKKTVREQLARALADYDNLKKRVETEKQTFVKIANLRLVSKLLTVLDSLESCQKHLNDSGLAITLGEFKKILKEEGLEEIEARVGEKFDENLHEAVDSVEGGKKGDIMEVVLPGWRHKDGVVVRHAKVKVFSGDKKEER